MDEVGKDFDLHVLFIGSAYQVRELWMRGWFATNTLDHRDPHLVGIRNDLFPLVNGHGAMRFGRATVGITMDTGQVAFFGDFEPHEMNVGLRHWLKQVISLPQ